MKHAIIRLTDTKINTVEPAMLASKMDKLKIVDSQISIAKSFFFTNEN
jgi:hypothetical protein